MTERKLSNAEKSIIAGIHAHAPMFGDLCEGYIRRRGLVAFEADIEEISIVIRETHEGKKVVGR